MAMTPEARCKAKIRKMLDAHHAYTIMPMGSGYGRSGILDFYCIHNGRPFVIEAKADTKVTQLQELEMAKVHAAGGFAFVVRLTKDGEESGFAELKLFLQAGE